MHEHSRKVNPVHATASIKYMLLHPQRPNPLLCHTRKAVQAPVSQLFTVNEALHHMGFGVYQWMLLFLCGISLLAVATQVTAGTFAHTSRSFHPTHLAPFPGRV